jgi:dihydrofolate reductase
MRKVIFWMTQSLDGCIAGPDGELDWHHVDEDVHRCYNEELARMGAFLEGRRMYELLDPFWSNLADDDDSEPEVMHEYARIWRRMPKYVFSDTLTEVGPNATIVRSEELPEFVDGLKGEPGGDLSLGGAALLASFLQHDLVDEFWLFTAPVILGSGTRLFPERDERMPLRLRDVRAFDNGVTLTRYERVRD